MLGAIEDEQQIGKVLLELVNADPVLFKHFVTVEAVSVGIWIVGHCIFDVEICDQTVILAFNERVNEFCNFSLVHVYLLVVEDVSELLDGSVMADELRHRVFLFRRDHEDVRAEVVFRPFPVAVCEDDDAVVVNVVGL